MSASSAQHALFSALAAYQPSTLSTPALRPAAVLVPLFAPVESPDDLHVWLMLRPNDGTPHGGQVSLPGGKLSPEDQGNLQSTALREAQEEFGLNPLDVALAGSLDDYATVTGYRIRPFVGVVPSAFFPIPNPHEVERAFSAPLRVFALPTVRQKVRWKNMLHEVAGHRIDNAFVWGATEAILTRLLQVLPRPDPNTPR